MPPKAGSTFRWTPPVEAFMVKTMVANQPAWQAGSGWKGTTWPSLLVKMRAAVANGTLNADLTNLTPEKISSHWEK
ncbi:hypothetical protein EV122DRAFT_280020, partial [Schizophyllum commune]